MLLCKLAPCCWFTSSNCLKIIVGFVSIGNGACNIEFKLVVHAGGFVRLSDQARNYWRGYAEEADLACLENNEPVAWISAEWLRSEMATNHKPHFLQMLLTVVSKSSPLQPEEDINALRAYLLATHPQGLTTASTPTLKWAAIGCSQPGSVALLSQIDNNYALGGTNDAASTLQQWISNWRAAGRPGFNELKAVCKKTALDWQVEVTI